MAREGESFSQYTGRRANDIARGLKAVMRGDLDVQLPIEEQKDEHEARIETLVLGFNMMCRELKRLDDIARNELDRAKEYIRLQQGTIQELSTPAIEIWDGILVVPIVGVVDTKRAAELMDNLLESISARRARCAILDLTGVPVVDTATADHLARIARAGQLLGARCVITGLRPAVAQTLVRVGIDLSGLTTQRSLKEGLGECIRFVERTSGGDVAGA